MAYSIPLTINARFVTIECYKCGVVFAVDETLQNYWKRDKTEWFCPNGHGQSYTENEADRLRRELAKVQQDRDWQKQRAASLESRLTREQKATSRLKRRIKAGVCPCCHRTVSQLARHMATEHPEYATKEG